MRKTTRRALNALCFLLLYFNLIAPAFGADTLTPNLGLTLPPAAPNTWGAQYNHNFEIMDGKFPGGIPTQFGVQDEGIDLNARPKINCVGGAITCSDNPGQNRIDLTVNPGSAGHLIQDEGTNVTSAPTLNFIGSSVSCVYNAIQDRINCTFNASPDLTAAYAWTGAHSWKDGSFSILNSADATKIAAFDLSGQTTGTTRTYSLPDATTRLWGNSDFSGNGCMAKTGSGTGASRTMTGTANVVIVTNGDCVSGNPLFNLGANVPVGTPTDDNVWVGDGSAWVKKALTNCPSGPMTYTASSNSWGCGTFPNGTPPGADTQFIFNDGGAFGADSGATYNKTTDVATFAGGAVQGNCATNCLTHDASAVIGAKTATWPNVSGTVQVNGAVNIDAETSGNTVTLPVKIWLPAAGGTAAAPYLMWDTLASNAPTASCSAGSTETTLLRCVADFPDSDGDYSLQQDLPLPPDWSGNIDFEFWWKAAATSGDAVWQATLVCRADGEVEDAAFNTTNTVTDTTKGTTLQLNKANINSATTTGCSAGELGRLKILRNRTHASDSITGVISLRGVWVTLRRAM